MMSDTVVKGTHPDFLDIKANIEWVKYIGRVLLRKHSLVTELHVIMPALCGIGRK